MFLWPELCLVEMADPAWLHQMRHSLQLLIHNRRDHVVVHFPDLPSIQQTLEVEHGPLED